MEPRDEELQVLCQTNGISGCANSVRFTEVQIDWASRGREPESPKRDRFREHDQKKDEPVEDSVEHGFGMFLNMSVLMSRLYLP
jgi:hypothetical protein